MEKENKKLESRQDVLDVWVSKWAVFVGKDVKRAVYSWSYAILIIFEEYTPTFSIYDILYSPESNFFEVMFEWNKRMPPCWMSKTYQEIVVFRGVYWEYMKCSCSISSHPLQYLLDNLNETLDF